MENQQETCSAALLKLFNIEPNTHCLHCGRGSKQWAQLTFGIFLCLNCAASFRQFSWVTQIKSINLDTWTREEVNRMQRGGNESFGKYLRNYGLELAQVRVIVTCKAAAYYRALLDGKAEGQQPGIQSGRQIAKEDIPITDMSPGEMLETAKEKAYWLGSKTKQLGERGVRKVQTSIESGELKEGAKKVATSVSTKAKWLWGVVRDKVGQIAHDIKQ